MVGQLSALERHSIEPIARRIRRRQRAGDAAVSP
jgi:hypothetical protein